MNTIFNTIIVLGGLGLFFGLLLSFAGVKLKTKENPKLEAMKDALPGVNCGGCGRAGCGAFAEDLFSGKATADGCPVGGTELNHKLAGILGVDAPESVPMKAFIKCAGTTTNSVSLYRYQGTNDCHARIRLTGGGAKACVYGCLGGSSCIDACMFDAITMLDGAAIIDDEKCVSCTMCVTACPKGLIEMVPTDKKVRVACGAMGGAKAVRASCSIGCIGCRLCQKKCEQSAIQMNKQLAEINYENCNNCKSCIEACPRKCIYGE